jgi:ribokinase
VHEGIDVTHVRRDRHSASGAALIFVSQTGENSIAVAGGANNRLTPADVRRARAVLTQAKVLLMQLETPLEAIEAAARSAASKGAVVILNPAPARSLPNRLLRQLSILTPNESEAELLTGVRLNGLSAAEKAAQKLLYRGVPTVVLTMGAKGALVATEDGSELIRGFAVKAVDTTAAGDVFNGALAVALTEGHPLRQAVRFANAAAAISVTCRGAQPSAPQRRSIEKLLKEH